jgi:hypothetical protein
MQIKSQKELLDGTWVMQYHLYATTTDLQEDFYEPDLCIDIYWQNGSYAAYIRHHQEGSPVAVFHHLPSYDEVVRAVNESPVVKELEND